MSREAKLLWWWWFWIVIVVIAVVLALPWIFRFLGWYFEWVTTSDLFWSAPK